MRKGEIIENSGHVSRRNFLAAITATSAAFVAGCATNPVSGEKQFMLITQSMEVNFDRKWAPQQFSADYGAVLDKDVNAYISTLGHEMGSLTHRPTMPYNFRALNAVSVNAYTMPAGSIGLNRGLLVEMDNEAQMTAIIGHELGHVNYRHGAERISKSFFLNAVIAGGAAYLNYKENKYADLAAGLGAIGANILLSKYSRDDEREADLGGLEYSARAGFNPKGMPEVMRKFMSLHKSQPSAVELLFATHPLSQERYENTTIACQKMYKDVSSRSMNRERYMDNIAGLRRIKSGIVAMQKGEQAMHSRKYQEAQQQFAAGLAVAKDDYAGLLMMGKCLMAQGKNDSAHSYVARAKEVYPAEPQSAHVSGMLGLRSGRYESALADFSHYEKKLPGNPNTIFYKGLCNEKMGRKVSAATEYERYNLIAPSGEFSKYARGSLINWGYITPPAGNK